MEAASRVVAVVGFALCAGVAVMCLWFLLTGRPILRAAMRRPDPRAAALARIFLCLGGCVITGTIAAGWTKSDPRATIIIGFPAWLVTISLSLFFLARARRAGR